MPKKVSRLPDVLLATGLSRSSVYRLIRESRFPAPLQLGPRAVGWDADAVEQWVATRPSTRTAA